MSREPEKDDFEARLWSSAREEAPPEATRERALAAALAAGIVGPSGGGGGGGGASPAAPSAAAKGLALGWKLAAFALLAGGAAALVVASQRPSDLATPPTSIASVSVPESASAAPIVVASTAASTAAPSEAPSAAASVAEPAPSAVPSASAAALSPPAPPASAAPRVPTLADEIGPIDAARAALARGDSARALRTLDDYDQRFPHGTLAPEATVIRIEALAASGDRAGARARANAFLAANPGSPLASRVRRAAFPTDPRTNP